jgi:hypothetical protein
MSELVLDRLELLFRERHEPRDPRPRGRPRGRPSRILVDPSGKIRIGDSVPGGEGPGVAEVKTSVFA